MHPKPSRLSDPIRYFITLGVLLGSTGKEPIDARTSQAVNSLINPSIFPMITKGSSEPVTVRVSGCRQTISWDHLQVIVSVPTKPTVVLMQVAILDFSVAKLTGTPVRVEDVQGKVVGSTKVLSGDVGRSVTLGQTITNKLTTSVEVR